MLSVDTQIVLSCFKSFVRCAVCLCLIVTEWLGSLNDSIWWSLLRSSLSLRWYHRFAGSERIQFSYRWDETIVPGKRLRLTSPLQGTSRPVASKNSVIRAEKSSRQVVRGPWSRLRRGAGCRNLAFGEQGPSAVNSILERTALGKPWREQHIDCDSWGGDCHQETTRICNGEGGGSGRL